MSVFEGVEPFVKSEGLIFSKDFKVFTTILKMVKRKKFKGCTIGK